MKSKLMVLAMVAAGFVGGMLSQWLFSGQRAAYAQPMYPTTQPVAKVFRAERFEVVDRNGTIRAVMGMRLGWPGLALFDKDGMLRAVLAVDNDVAGLRLTNEKGRDRACLIARENAAGLALHDKDGKERAALAVNADGSPGLTLLDKDGKVSAVTGMTSDGALGLGLDDKDGNEKPSWKLINLFHFECLECGHKYELTEEETIKAGHFQGPPETAKSMPHMWLPINCPKCGGEQTAYRCQHCPACRGWYLPAQLRGETVKGMGECPLCGTDLMEWYKEQWRKRRLGR